VIIAKRYSTFGCSYLHVAVILSHNCFAAIHGRRRKHDGVHAPSSVKTPELLGKAGRVKQKN
jgi:hypothetical protein